MVKAATCDNPENVTKARNLVNLAVLQQFFNDSQLGELAGNTLLTEKLRASLHHFLSPNYGRPLSVSGRPCYILPMFF